MRLNAVETALMNNPVRAAIQSHLEARRLLALGGTTPGACALEVGCGRGVGAELILDRFGAARVDAFDLDPRMLALARRRLGRRGDRVRLWVGSVTEIAAADATYDAVFDFGIIHHVSEWRRALSEIQRVLRPGGRLFAEEVFARFISDPLWRRLLAHPQQDRFDDAGFRQGLESAGFRVVATQSLWNRFGWFVADRVDG
jgi:ubiquinone/menaquinone biosynthesis C-methylase UbiE